MTMEKEGKRLEFRTSIDFGRKIGDLYKLAAQGATEKYHELKKQISKKIEECRQAGHNIEPISDSYTIAINWCEKK